MKSVRTATVKSASSLAGVAAILLIVGFAGIATAGPIEVQAYDIQSLELLAEEKSASPTAPEPDRGDSDSTANNHPSDVREGSGTTQESHPGTCHKTLYDWVGTGTWPVCYGTPTSC